ncbi:hypothetical protein MMC20_006837 [Loxospora ochrophaea]|nr:hypothetical protein [Loxospora ochrophaea]
MATPNRTCTKVQKASIARILAIPKNSVWEHYDVLDIPHSPAPSSKDIASIGRRLKWSLHSDKCSCPETAIAFARITDSSTALQENPHPSKRPYSPEASETGSSEGGFEFFGKSNNRGSRRNDTHPGWFTNGSTFFQLRTSFFPSYPSSAQFDGSSPQFGTTFSQFETFCSQFNTSFSQFDTSFPQSNTSYFDSRPPTSFTIEEIYAEADRISSTVKSKYPEKASRSSPTGEANSSSISTTFGCCCSRISTSATGKPHNSCLNCKNLPSNPSTEPATPKIKTFADFGRRSTGFSGIPHGSHFDGVTGTPLNSHSASFPPENTPTHLRHAGGS